jgi:metallo-beta-lactamase class B
VFCAIVPECCHNWALPFAAQLQTSQKETRNMQASTVAALAALMTSSLTAAHAASPFKPDADIHCDACPGWNKPQPPFRVFGNTYYVGVAGLSSILITSKEGLVLLDGGLPQSAVQIDNNIRALGFRAKDIHYIVNSHVHYDHAGGIAALQRASGAIVAASPASARVLEAGTLQSDDPQYGFGKQETSFPPVKNVREIADGETLRVGDIEITAHFTPGHTPGGTTWTWRSCEDKHCVDIVYADSLNAISADGFRFSDSPARVKSFRHSIAIVEKLPCDIMIAVHPEAADIKGKLARIKAGEKGNSFIDQHACRQYAEAAAKRLDARIVGEQHQ